MSLANWISFLVYNALSIVVGILTTITTISSLSSSLNQPQENITTMSHLENPQQLNLDVDAAHSDAGSSVDDRSDAKKQQDKDLANR
jgi:hypothetical protein